MWRCSGLSAWESCSQFFNLLFKERFSTEHRNALWFCSLRVALNPLYESKASCIVLIVKITFHSNWYKTYFNFTWKAFKLWSRSRNKVESNSEMTYWKSSWLLWHDQERFPILGTIYTYFLLLGLVYCFVCLCFDWPELLRWLQCIVRLAKSSFHLFHVCSKFSENVVRLRRTSSSFYNGSFTL